MSPRYRFSGHETFPFRYPWLPKGIRALIEDPKVFFRDDAIVTLGVGKNMVASIRFWCEALKLAVVDGRAHMGKGTTLGLKLFGERGWDPYLEDPGTLWLLHWQLVDSPEIASTWSLLFTRWNRDVFSRTEILDWLTGIADKAADKRTSRNSLKRDLDVFLRTYVPSRADRRRSLEDTFDCPLVELGLVRRLEADLYRFDRGAKPGLPIEVFAYALVRYWNAYARGQETLSFERLLYGPSSPGAAFRLSESALAGLLEALPTWTTLGYDETAGLRLVIRRDSGRLQDPLHFLERYYQSRSNETAA
jgi:Protein of unknown function (DUF4007)